MPIIFLDIDGVLNSEASCRAAWQARGSTSRTSRAPGPDMLDPPRVAHLESLVQRTGAKVVISSNWRCWPECRHETIAGWLRDLGFTGEAIGQTPMKMSYISRGSEISLWLRDNPCDDFVILDNLMYGEHSAEWLAPHQARLVFTRDGMEANHVEKAARMLQGEKR